MSMSLVSLRPKMSSWKSQKLLLPVLVTLSRKLSSLLVSPVLHQLHLLLVVVGSRLVVGAVKSLQFADV